MMPEADLGDVSRIVRTLSPQSAATANIIPPYTDKHHALVEYALAGMDNRLRAAKYLFELPEKDEMQRFTDEPLREVEE
jgi:hypothetical protein